MIVQTPAREAPAAPPSSEPDPSGVDPSFPAVPNEPVLCIQNIQGNILDGFKKDFQVLLFLEIVDVVAFKAWLKSLVPFIATAAELDFVQMEGRCAEAPERSGARGRQIIWMSVRRADIQKSRRCRPPLEIRPCAAAVSSWTKSS
jgi:Dyp-type peroxidase family protein